MPKTTVVVDFTNNIIRNAAIVEIRPETKDGRELIRYRVVEAFRLCINAGRTDSAWSRSLKQALHELPNSQTDKFLANYFTRGDPVDHLEGAWCPIARIGHPPNPKDTSKLNLSNEQGTFIGQVRNAWFERRQLRADIDLSKPAPIEDWVHIRATLLSCIARSPESVACSISYESSPLRPIGVDLVCRPRFNRNGMLGHPRARLELIGSPGIIPMESYHERVVWNWLARVPEPHVRAGVAGLMGIGSPT